MSQSARQFDVEDSSQVSTLAGKFFRSETTERLTRSLADVIDDGVGNDEQGLYFPRFSLIIVLL